MFAKEQGGRGFGSDATPLAKGDIRILIVIGKIPHDIDLIDCDFAASNVLGADGLRSGLVRQVVEVLAVDLQCELFKRLIVA